MQSKLTSTKTQPTTLDNANRTSQTSSLLFGRKPVFTPLATNISDQPGTTSYTDTNAPATSPLFSRVGVGN